MRRLFKVVVFLAVILSYLTGGAQNYPVYNSYYINPYLYSPAEVATENTSLFLDHKRQWIGIEGAPTSTTVSFNTLLNHKRAGIGAKLSNYSRGILSTSDISFSYCYGLLLNRQKSTFFFGMSAGSISSSIDMSRLTATDLVDPAIAYYLANNFQPTASFGMLLRSSKGLNFGVTLPQLFEPDFNQSSNFGATQVTPLDNAIISFYYKKMVAGKLVHRKKRGIKAKVKEADHAAPLEFYSLYKYSKSGTSQLEATVKFNFTPYVWLAGGYRQSYGFIASGGIALNNLIINYSFEPGSQPAAGFSTGTHELTLGLKLGKPKVFKRITPLLRSTLKTAPNEQHLARFQQSVEDPANIDQPQDENVKKKYYVVLKGFADFNTADTYKKKIIEQKYNADIFYYEKEKKFYVYVFQTTKASEASEEVRTLKNYTKLKEARVLTVEEAK